MKKKLILALALCMATTLAVPSVAFATDTVTVTAPVYEAASVDALSAINANVKFTTPTISLTLQGAYDKILTSSSMDSIKYALEGEKAAQSSYRNLVSSLNKDDAYDTTGKAEAKLNRDFAAATVDDNYTARVNKLKKQVYDKYYNLKSLEAATEVDRQSDVNQQEILKATELKYKVGTISKMEYLTAQVTAKGAHDKYLGSVAKLKGEKMSFNIFMGYDLMQDVKLTDALTEAALPTTTLADTIASAKKDNLEIRQAAHDLAVSKAKLDVLNAYPHSSPKYIIANTEYLGNITANNSKAAEIEATIKGKYMTMMASYEGVQTGKQTVANAMEAARLAKLQYDAGMSTLTDVQKAQNDSVDAQNGQAEALLAYNLAVEDYKLCYGIGITPAEF